MKKTKITTVFMALVIVIVIFFFVGSDAYAQDNSICGEVRSRSASGGYSPVLVVWETNQYIFLPPDDMNLYNQLTGLGIPGYYRFYDPVITPDLVSLSSYSYIEKVTSCEATPTPTTLPTATSTHTPEPTLTKTPLPTSTRIIPSATSIPVTVTTENPPATQVPPTQPIETTGPVVSLPLDGPRSPSGLFCFIPGFCVQAAEANITCHPQCVETVNKLRSDLPIWGSVMTSDQILAVAELKPIFKFQNEMQQVRVRDVNELPQSGDIVIWPHDCDYAWSGGGHIGYVTNGNPFRITDSNWDSVCGPRINEQIKIKSCMRFITSPYPVNSSNDPLSPAVIETPIPGIVPTPSGQPFNPFQWIFDLFHR